MPTLKSLKSSKLHDSLYNTENTSSEDDSGDAKGSAAQDPEKTGAQARSTALVGGTGENPRSHAQQHICHHRQGASAGFTGSALHTTQLHI